MAKKKGKLDLKFTVDTSKPVKNIDELNKRIEKLRDTIEGAPLGSEEFDRLTAQLQNASSEMKVLEKNMEGLEPQQKAEAFLKMGEGIAGGFAVAQGAMGLMGIESENMEKIQVKVQSAIAIATGIRMMSEAALMAATAKRVAVEKLGIIQTKIGIGLSKAMAIGNAAWAVGQGVLTGSVAATTVGLHALRAAIAATGIGALALLIIGLVAAVFSYASSTDKSTAAQERHAAATRATRDALLEKTNAMLALGESYKSQKQHEYDLQDAETESEKTLLKKQRKLESMEATLESFLETQRSNNELLAEHGHDEAWLKRNQATIDGLNEKIRVQVEYNKAQMDSIRATELQIKSEEQAEEKRKTYRSRRKERQKQDATELESLRKLQNELFLLEIEDDDEREQSKIEQQRQEALRAAESIRKESTRLETINEINKKFDILEKNRLQKIQDEKDKIQEDADKEAKKKAEEHQAALDKSTDEYLEEIRRKNLDDQQRELEDIKSHYQNMLLAKDLTDEEKLKLHEDYKAREKEINDRYQSEQDTKDQESRDAQIEAGQQLLDAFSANIDARGAELDRRQAKELAVEGLTEEQKEKINAKFQKKKDRLAKRQKAIQAAQAAINTFVGATRAIADLGPIAGPIAASAIILGGLASIRQIYAQDVGDGGGGGGVDVEDTTESGEESTPKTGSFTLGGGEQQEPMRAYVVTDDVTDSQSQLEDIRQESTI
ncbi:MAG: hypothetical protein Unbinned4585contig1001_29 [Prokaryotic dsDNA virus sp.]|nr:MAG: hypothetical protein Unbinned4585contig1001_29 [Prokaryotic dsDNA virus sp.]|tara:strand:- start:1855 stop:4017 length:2163 start_codon:yes stop_codon:yes gene_type:complete